MMKSIGGFQLRLGETKLAYSIPSVTESVCEVGSAPALDSALGSLLHHFATPLETRIWWLTPSHALASAQVLFPGVNQQGLSREHTHVVPTKPSALVLSQLFYSRFLDFPSSLKVQRRGSLTALFTGEGNSSSSSDHHHWRWYRTLPCQDDFASNTLFKRKNNPMKWHLHLVEVERFA